MSRFLSIGCAFIIGGLSSRILSKLMMRLRKKSPISQKSHSSPNSMLEVLVKLQAAVTVALNQSGGPEDVFDWEDVSAAPKPTIDVSSMRPGDTTSFSDDRGTIYRFKVTEGVILNLYFTKKGVRRSGDLHDSNQFDLVLKGRVRLRQIDPDGKEIVSIHEENEYIIIPPGTPHLFEMLEDNVLIEWWGSEFKAWYYKPYREIINNALPLGATDHKDFSRSC